MKNQILGNEVTYLPHSTEGKQKQKHPVPPIIVQTPPMALKE